MGADNSLPARCFMDQQQELESVFISAQIGARLRKAREDRGLTQSELADRVNASQVQIDHYEHGGLDMPVVRLFDIAAALEVMAGDLLAD
jgi:transcriptional regulator with XRE-family HTH domain